MESENLPWAKWPWKRCKAYRENDGVTGFWGRCELVPGHKCLHALERGMDIPRWSTRWICTNTN